MKKSTPADSDVELNSPNVTQFEPKQLEMSAVLKNTSELGLTL